MSQLPQSPRPSPGSSRRAPSGGRRPGGRSALSLPAAAVLVVLLISALAFVVWHNRSGAGTSATGPVSASTGTRSGGAAGRTAGSGSSGSSGSAGSSGSSGSTGSSRTGGPKASTSRGSSGLPTVGRVGSGSGAVSGDVKAKAEAVLAVVDRTGRAPQGYVGGRQFRNDGRGGTTPLPRTDASGAAVTYHEYDVNPYHQGVNRGPERLVVGSDGSAYCTDDHYVTWVQLR